MCSMMGVAIGAQGVATLLQGDAAKKHGEAVKAEEFRTADAAERAANDAIERGKLKETQVVLHGSSVVAAQRVIQSGSGVDVNIGPTKATQEGTAAVSEVDRKTVAHNAMMEAYGFKVRARAHRQQGLNAQAEGDNAMLGTFLGGIARGVGEGGRYAADQAPGVDENVSRPSEEDFNEQGL